jgi:hypothetical protein
MCHNIRVLTQPVQHASSIYFTHQKSVPLRYTLVLTSYFTSGFFPWYLPTITLYVRLIYLFYLFDTVFRVWWLLISHNVFQNVPLAHDARHWNTVAPVWRMDAIVWRHLTPSLQAFFRTTWSAKPSFGLADRITAASDRYRYVREASEILLSPRTAYKQQPLYWRNGVNCIHTALHLSWIWLYRVSKSHLTPDIYRVPSDICTTLYSPGSLPTAVATKLRLLQQWYICTKFYAKKSLLRNVTKADWKAVYKLRRPNTTFL